MKYAILTFLIAVTSAFSQQALSVGNRPLGANQSQEVLPSNYELRLKLTDQENPPQEVAVVVSSRTFQMTVTELGIVCAGTVSPQEDDSLLVTYQFNWSANGPAEKQPQQAGNTLIHGSVRLISGKEIQILRTPTKRVNLSVQQLQAEKK